MDAYDLFYELNYPRIHDEINALLRPEFRSESVPKTREWLLGNAHEFDGGAGAHIELPSHQTLSGNTVVFDLIIDSRPVYG